MYDVDCLMCPFVFIFVFVFVFVFFGLFLPLSWVGNIDLHISSFAASP